MADQKDIDDVKNRYLEVFADHDDQHPYLATLIDGLTKGRTKTSILADIDEAARNRHGKRKEAALGWHDSAML